MSDGNLPALPAPLTPAECDLRSHEWFPLYFDRLRKSKWWRRASDTARARNIMLWGEAFKQLPAGSLPNDDDELAEAAGYGMDVDAFLAHKDEIMAPWMLCSDGRWYHPTVAEMVLNAWDQVSERRKAGAARQAAYRARIKSRDASAQDPTGNVTSPNPDVTDHQDDGDASPPTEGDAGDASSARRGEERRGKEKRGEARASARDGGGLFDDEKPAPAGRRLPEDWKPTLELRAYGRQLGFSEARIDSIAEDFRLYWIAQAGAKGRKADWGATWQGWLRREAERHPPQKSTGRQDWI